MEILHLCTNVILTLLVIIATVSPIIKNEHWVVRFFDFPYVQFTFLNACTIFLWIWYFDKLGGFQIGLILLLLIALAFRAKIIFPYTPLSKKQAVDAGFYTDDAAVKIISANVLMYNDDFSGLIALVKQEDPDMLLLVETDKKWEQAVTSEFGETFAHQVLKPIDNTYGILLYSKYSLSHSRIHFLVEEDVPSIETTVTLPNGERFQFFGLHPKPPSPSENETSLPRDAELVIVGEKVKQCPLPVLVAGDLNDVAWSHTTRLFIRISGLLDPRIGRGFFNTYPANHPLLRWPLDHMFVSPEFQIISIKRLDNFHSDHFSMCMHVALKPDEKSNKFVKKPNGEDKEEAKEKVSRVHEGK